MEFLDLAVETLKDAETRHFLKDPFLRICSGIWGNSVCQTWVISDGGVQFDFQKVGSVKYRRAANISCILWSLCYAAIHHDKVLMCRYHAIHTYINTRKYFMTQLNLQNPLQRCTYYTPTCVYIYEIDL